MSEDPYQRLGVMRGASPEAIRRAYRRRAKQLHPDVGGSPGEMARLNAALEAVTTGVQEPARPTIYRAPRGLRLRPRAATSWSDATRKFAEELVYPQARLLRVALDRLEREASAARPRQLSEVATSTGLALAMTGSRLARAPWPAELDEARTLLGEALRHFSDAVTDFELAPEGSSAPEARRMLVLGRRRLAQALAALPGP